MLSGMCLKMHLRHSIFTLNSELFSRHNLPKKTLKILLSCYCFYEIINIKEATGILLQAFHIWYCLTFKGFGMQKSNKTEKLKRNTKQNFQGTFFNFKKVLLAFNSRTVIIR